MTNLTKKSKNRICQRNFNFNEFQLEPGQELPPPALLKRKIIIKNKKKHHHHHHKKHQKKPQMHVEGIEEGIEPNEANGSETQSAKGENGPPPDIIPQSEVVDGVVVGNGNSEHQNGEVHPPMLQQRQGSKDSTQDDDGLVLFLLNKIEYHHCIIQVE